MGEVFYPSPIPYRWTVVIIVVITPHYVAFLLLSLFLLILIGGGAWRTAILLRTWQPEQNLLLSPPELAVRLVLVAFCIFLGRLSGLPQSLLGWQATNLSGELIWGISIGLVLGSTLNPLTRWAIRIWGKGIYSPVVMRNVMPRSNSELIGVTLAFIPAVLLEELLFRSLLLGGAGTLLSVPGRWLLAVGLSVLFGILHLPQGRWGVVITTLAGLVFSALFLLRGSLLAPILAHYLTNLLQLYLAYAGRNSPNNPLRP